MKFSLPYNIDKVIDTLDVQYLYIFPLGEQHCVLVVQKDADTPGSNLTSLAAIFATHPQYLCRVYTERYVKTQLVQGNIFFLQGCLPRHLHHCAPGAPGLFREVAIEQLPGRAETYFQKEFGKAVGFKDGAQFYLDKENLPQATFMLHQAFELAYRTVELFTMGKEKVCHRIASHQKYILPFVPEFGQIFSVESEQEIQLVKLLDMAYRDVRYNRDYHIAPEQITVFQAKLEMVLGMAKKAFYNRFYSCKELVAE